MANDSFDKISEKLNTTYDEEIEKVEHEVEKFEEKKKELVEKSSAENLGFEDKEYLQKETKDLIDNGKKVLETLQNEIKIGSPPRMFEVYAFLMNGIISGLKELRGLNKSIAELNIIENQPEPEDKRNVNIILSGKELLDMINSAKDNSEINRIDADFKVEDQIKKDEEDRRDGKI